MLATIPLLSRRALQLTGSTTLLPRMQRASEAFMAAHPARIVINGGCGTARGYKALLDGTTDIAMASGAVPEPMAAAAAARGLAFIDTVVSEDAIVPVVNASNSLANLTLLDLGNIFTGRVANWRELGGPDAAIAVLVGPPSGGVSTSWRLRLLGADDSFTPTAQVLDIDARLERTAQQARAITYIPQAALAGRRVRALRVDGVDVAVQPAAWPLRAPMMLVTLGAAAPDCGTFIAWAASHA